MSETMTLLVRCDACGKGFEIVVPVEGYLNWTNNDQLIQKALPGLSDDERELLLSGTCGPCFDSFFEEDDEPTSKTEL